MAQSAGQIALDLVLNRRGFERDVAGIQGLAKKAGKLLASAFAVKKIADFSKQCIELGSDLAEVQNVVDVTFPRMSKQVDDFAKGAAASFGLSETMSKRFTGTFGAMSKAFGFSEKEAYEMSTALTGLTGDVASFYNISQDEAYTKLKSVFTGETESLKDLGVVMTQSALDAYALANGFGKVTSKMTEAEKVSLRYKFVQDQLSAASGDFARTADSWANQVRLLKLQFDSLKATIGQSFINALKPLVQGLNVAIGKFHEFAIAVSNAFGKIFGWKYETSAGDVGEITDEVKKAEGAFGDAAKAADKFRTKTLGIDELNINSPDKGGSGDGGISGGGVPGASSSGDWIQTEKLFESTIKDLEGLGEFIGKALTDELNSIDWDSVYKGADNFGTGLAQFLNGLISPELFGTVGKTVAGSLNTSLHFLNSFGRTFKFKDYGKSLSMGAIEFFETWDAGLTGETLSTFASGILEAMTGALETLVEEDAFETIGQKIVDFICGIEWDELLWSLGGFFSALSEAIINIPVDLAEGIVEGIAENIFGADIDIDIPKWIEELIGGAATGGISSFLPDLETMINFVEVAAKWDEQIAIFWDEHITPWFTAKKWSELGQGILDGISLKWDEFQTWWGETAIVKWWNDDVSPWFTLKKWSDTAENMKTSIKTKWNETVGEWKTNIGNWWSVHVEPWFTVEKWDAILKSIPECFKKAFKGAGNFAIDCLNGVISGVEKLINKALEGLNEFISELNNIPLVDIPFSFSGVSLPKIPKLAQGGFVKANTPQLAMIGDNRHYGEIVSPEDKLQEMANMAALLASKQEGQSKEKIEEILTILRISLEVLKNIEEKDPEIVFDTDDGIEAFRKRIKRKGIVFTE